MGTNSKMVKKIIKISFTIILILVIGVGLLSIKHPILLKWITGTARMVGRPVAANVFPDDTASSNIDVFRIYKFFNGSPTNYLILFKPKNKTEYNKILAIQLAEHFVGRPVSMNNQDYDYFWGILFQSEVGEHFTPLQDDIKGLNFDPRLEITSSMVYFNLPPNNYFSTNTKFSIQL